MPRKFRVSGALGFQIDLCFDQAHPRFSEEPLAATEEYRSIQAQSDHFFIAAARELLECHRRYRRASVREQLEQ